SAATKALVCDGHAGIGIENFQVEDGGGIRSKGGRIRAQEGGAPDLRVIADAFEPATAADAHFVKEAPVAKSDIGHHAGGAMELCVGFALWGRKIADNVFGGPTAAGHDDGAGFEAKKFVALSVDDGNGLRFGGVSLVLDPDDAGVQADTSGGRGLIESGEVHAA